MVYYTLEYCAGDQTEAASCYCCSLNNSSGLTVEVSTITLTSDWKLSEASQKLRIMVA